jgi:hypothetical protein
VKTVQNLIEHAERLRPEEPASVRIVQQDGSAQEAHPTVAELLDLLRRLPADTALSPPRVVALACSYSLDPGRLDEFGQMSFVSEKPPFWDPKRTMYNIPAGRVPPASFVVTLPA